MKKILLSAIVAFVVACGSPSDTDPAGSDLPDEVGDDDVAQEDLGSQSASLCFEVYDKAPELILADDVLTAEYQLIEDTKVLYPSSTSGDDYVFHDGVLGNEECPNGLLYSDLSTNHEGGFGFEAEGYGQWHMMMFSVVLPTSDSDPDEPLPEPTDFRPGKVKVMDAYVVLQQTGTLNSSSSQLLINQDGGYVGTRIRQLQFDENGEQTDSLQVEPNELNVFLDSCQEWVEPMALVDSEEVVVVEGESVLDQEDRPMLARLMLVRNEVEVNGIEFCRVVVYTTTHTTSVEVLVQ
ncbi:hypothetical protein ACFLZY_01180 [Patescibacteria group bacterium]